MAKTTTIDLNDQFQHALLLMEETDRCLFITGKAGTGKSTLLSHFCASTKKKPVVLAPTGVAALNVKGQTIHKFFHFYIDVTPDKIRKKQTKPRNPKLYKKLKTIIIDEVSMVRADLLDCIDMFLRMYGPDAAKPFGGVQMIFVGDLYQLPPVVSGPEKEIFTTHYKTPYFFSAHALRDAEPEIVELEKVYRQKDQTFVDLLNRIRNNSVEEADMEHLNQRFQPNYAPRGKEFYISLTTTNQKADEINESHLSALKGKLHGFPAHISGDFGKEYYPTATDLKFKIGAQVMMVSNDQDRRWVNGSIGVIEALKTDEEDTPYLEIRLQDDKELVSVYPFTWEVYKFALEGGMIVSEPVGTFTQFPFRLAWAVTIHKSQGKTFDRVIIDIDRGTFVAGQMYVALSRCTSFEGIVLKTRIQKNHIRTDFRIFEFLTGYQYKKSEADLSLDGKMDLIRKAIKEKAKLTMTYLKANDTKSERVVIPITVGKEKYQGKEYPGMKAFCTKRKEERMFRVDRILKVERV
ncbi:MAG: AAA family ATPase [Rickettsiales bacterium]